MMPDGHLSAWVGQTILVLGLSGVAFIVLKTLLLGDTQVAAASRLRKRFVRTHDLTNGSAGRVSHRPSECGGDKRRSLRRHGNPVRVSFRIP
jgi:hypothetical protein